MAVDEEPIRIGAIFSESFAFIKAEWQTLFALVGILAVAMVGYTLAAWPVVEAAAGPNPPTTPVGLSRLWWALAAFMIIFNWIYSAALAFSLDRLGGRETGFAKALATGLRLFIPLLVIRILVYLAAGFGLLLVVVPGVIFYIMFYVADAAYVEERPGIFAALSRSRYLTKGSRWRVFLLLVVVALISIGFSLVQAAALQLGFAAYVIVSGLFVLLFYAFAPVLTAVLFRHLRQRREGVGAAEAASVF